MNKIDLTGERRGKLIILNENFSTGKTKRHWDCICDCGRKTTVRQSSLKVGSTESCGVCIYENCNSSKPEYKTWKEMKRRCYNTNCKAYSYYGGRGICVCSEWKDDFNAFYDYIGPKPCKEACIDRINPNGNYEPGNVRWANRQVSSINTRIRKTNTSGVTGVSYQNSGRGKKRWKAAIVRHGKTYFLGRFATKQEAVKARKEAEKKFDN